MSSRLATPKSPGEATPHAAVLTAVGLTPFARSSTTCRIASALAAPGEQVLTIAFVQAQTRQLPSCGGAGQAPEP